MQTIGGSSAYALRSLQNAHLVAKLIPIVFDQRLGHGRQVAADNLVELVKRQANAMVRDPVVGPTRRVASGCSGCCCFATTAFFLLMVSLSCSQSVSLWLTR